MDQSQAHMRIKQRLKEPEEDEGNMVQWTEAVNSHLNSAPNLLCDFLPASLLPFSCASISTHNTKDLNPGSPQILRENIP